MNNIKLFIAGVDSVGDEVLVSEDCNLVVLVKVEKVKANQEKTICTCND